MGFLVIGGMGMLKAANIPAFEDTLRGWSIIPESLRTPVAFLIPAAEIAVCACWIANLASAWLPFATLLLLSTLTGTALWQSALTGLPACGCFGILEQYRSFQSELISLLVRNSIIASLVATALLLRPRPLPSALNSAPNVPSPTRRAFTLVELLVSISIIAVLVGISLWAVRGTSRARESAETLARLRQHATIFNQYAGDSRDSNPYFADPATGVLNLPRRFTFPAQPYFASYAYWNYALADAYYAGREFDPSFYPSRYPEATGPIFGPVGPTPFHYPCTFVAHRSYWNPTTRLADSSQLGPTLLSSVAFPTRKLLLISSYPVELEFDGLARSEPRFRTEAATSDGAALVLRLADIADGYPSGDGLVPGILHGVGGPFGLHTLNGVAGTDLP